MPVVDCFEQRSHFRVGWSNSLPLRPRRRPSRPVFPPRLPGGYNAGMSEEQKATDSSKLVEVFRASNAAEAHLLSDILNDAGIANRIDGEFLQGAIGEVPPGWQSAPRIMVLERHAQNARAIIDGLQQSRRAK